MTKPLTDTQAAVLEFIKAYLCEHQRVPTRKAISHHFGWRSPNASQEHLDRLVARGYITKGKDYKIVGFRLRLDRQQKGVDH